LKLAVHAAVAEASVTDEQAAIALAPSRKVTVPEGVPFEPESETWIVTLCPARDGFAEEVNENAASIFGGGFTVCVKAAEVAESYAASPEYCTVIVWAPGASVFVVQEALALADNVSVAQPESVVPPSRKLTVPVGVPALPETAACSVTAWLMVEGLAVEVTAIDAAAFDGAFTVCVTVFEVAALYSTSPA